MGILALRELDMARAETSIRKVLDLAPDDEIARRQLAVIRRYKDRPSDHNLDVYLKFQQLRE